ncbi:MAG: hypothetical protein WBI17_03680 [Clostridiaceae bacterium]
MAEEGLTQTRNPLIFICKPNAFDKDLLMSELAHLKEIIVNKAVSNNMIKKAMSKVGNTYKYQLNKEEEA